MRFVPFHARSVHAVLLACLVGCGSRGKGDLYPVTGTFMVYGHPAANAMIAFHRLDQDHPPSILPVATTDQDGRYKLTTYEAGDGAPVGTYAVTVVWPDDSQRYDECEGVLTHDRFNANYADPAKSPWRVTISPGANEVPLQAYPRDWRFPPRRAETKKLSLAHDMTAPANDKPKS